MIQWRTFSRNLLPTMRNTKPRPFKSTRNHNGSSGKRSLSNGTNVSYASTNGSASIMDVDEMKLNPLPLGVVRQMSAEQKAILLRELSDSFNRKTLQSVPLYQALMTGKNTGPETSEDVKLAKMVNQYPVKEKRARLKLLLLAYEKGGNIVEEVSSTLPVAPEVTPPTPQNPELEVHQSKKPNNGVAQPPPKTPGVVILADHVVDIGKFSLDREFLHKITDFRFAMLTNYMAELEKTSKHHPRLQNPAVLKSLRDALALANDQTNALFSLDMEAHEMNTNVITEIGISIYDPAEEATSLVPNFKNIHILPEEQIRLRNGAFVADNKDRFLGGNSLILPKIETVKLVQSLIDFYFIERQDKGLNAVLVGHNVGGDIKWLKSMGVTFPENMQILDTQTIYGYTFGQDNSSLGAILRRFDVPHAYLHNAGNDAYYTLALLMKLCDPVFRHSKGVDSFKKSEDYDNKLENRRLNADTANPFQGTRASRPRKKQKNFEALPPARYRNFRDALKDVFETRGI